MINQICVKILLFVYIVSKFYGFDLTENLVLNVNVTSKYHNICSLEYPCPLESAINLFINNETNFNRSIVVLMNFGHYKLSKKYNLTNNNKIIFKSANNENGLYIESSAPESNRKAVFNVNKGNGDFVFFNITFKNLKLRSLFDVLSGNKSIEFHYCNFTGNFNRTLITLNGGSVSKLSFFSSSIKNAVLHMCDLFQIDTPELIVNIQDLQVNFLTILRTTKNFYLFRFSGKNIKFSIKNSEIINCEGSIIKVDSSHSTNIIIERSEFKNIRNKINHICLFSVNTDSFVNEGNLKVHVTNSMFNFLSISNSVDDIIQYVCSNCNNGSVLIFHENNGFVGNNNKNYEDVINHSSLWSLIEINSGKYVYLNTSVEILIDIYRNNIGSFSTGFYVYIEKNNFPSKILLRNIQVKNNIADVGASVFVMNSFDSIVNLNMMDKCLFSNNTSRYVKKIDRSNGMMIIIYVKSHFNVNLTNSHFYYNNDVYGGVLSLYKGTATKYKNNENLKSRISKIILNVRKCNFTGQRSRYGGVMYIESNYGDYVYPKVNIHDSFFCDNVAAISGGVLNVRKVELNIFSSIFESSQIGGCITSSESSLYIMSSTFRNNYNEENGGALFSVHDVTIIIEKSNFSNNNAIYFGGAIHVESIQWEFNLKTDVEISDSTSLYGGGCFINTESIRKDMIVLDGHIFDNHAICGGGVFFARSVAQCKNCVNNKAENGDNVLGPPYTWEIDPTSIVMCFYQQKNNVKKEYDFFCEFNGYSFYDYFKTKITSEFFVPIYIDFEFPTLNHTVPYVCTNVNNVTFDVEVEKGLVGDYVGSVTFNDIRRSIVFTFIGFPTTNKPIITIVIIVVVASLLFLLFACFTISFIVYCVWKMKKNKDVQPINYQTINYQKM